jgi:hypothetical protein
LKYEDGFTAAQHYAAWTDYLKAYCLERARKGLFIEAASDNYNGVAIKGIYNLVDFAGDAELRRRAGLLLDLFWATWAQEQFDGARGGGKARIYQGKGDSLRGGGSHIQQLAWFYFGLGKSPKSLMCPLLSALTSAWRPPAIVADMASDPEGRGRYAIIERPQGLAEEGFHRLPVYHVRTDRGGVVRYSWCTPGFILGTLLFEAPGAFAAVRVVTGGVRWEPSTVEPIKGQWLTCEDEWSPVILEVAEKKDFGDLAAFEKAVAALPLSFERGRLTYRGLSGDEFVFRADFGGLPEINGKPVDYAPAMVFESPFVRSDWNSGVVTLAKGERKLVLDFNKP